MTLLAYDFNSNIMYADTSISTMTKGKVYDNCKIHTFEFEFKDTTSLKIIISASGIMRFTSDSIHQLLCYLSKQIRIKEIKTARNLFHVLDELTELKVSDSEKISDKDTGSLLVSFCIKDEQDVDVDFQCYRFSISNNMMYRENHVVIGDCAISGSIRDVDARGKFKTVEDLFLHVAQKQDTVGGYLTYIRFDNLKQINIYSNINLEIAKQLVKESGYEIPLSNIDSPKVRQDFAIKEKLFKPIYMKTIVE